MQKRTFTPAEKAAYFQSLRDRWNAVKAMSEDERASIAATLLALGIEISENGFYYVLRQMKAQGLDGLPYLDAKTFEGWRANGFSVRKGERSTLEGITWLKVRQKANDGAQGDDEHEGKGYAIPKAYRLFHRSQVEPRIQ